MAVRALATLAVLVACSDTSRADGEPSEESAVSDSGPISVDPSTRDRAAAQTFLASTVPAGRDTNGLGTGLDTDDSGARFEACDEPLEALLSRDRLAVLGPDTDSYRPLSDDDRTGITNAIYSVVEGEARTATDRAEAAGYRLCGDGSERVLLAPRFRGTGHAAVVIDLSDDATPVILEAPHPIFDSGTLEESLSLLEQTQARALVVSGTHRCASYRQSGCHGTANACGFMAPVRESDMAHAVDSVYHAAHVALTTAFPETWVISIHGFGGPGISVSNGTTDPVDTESRLARFAAALAARFADVTTCNEFGSGDVPRAVRLCGTTNVQGRHLNGAAWECTKQAFDAADRFLHLEQSSTVRHEDSDAIAEAILETLMR